MKLSLSVSQKNAHSLSVAVISARLFTTASIDMADLGNSAWLCIAGGMLLSLPLAFITDMKRRSCTRGSGKFAVCAAAFVISIFEAAATTGLITDTIRCCGMFNARSGWIITGTLIICLYALFKGSPGICNAARMCSILAIPAVVLIVLVQMRHYRPAWLCPVFGPGAASLLSGTLRAAGYFSFALFAHASSPDKRSRKNSCCASVIISGIAVCILSILRGMMAPVIVSADVTRFQAIDMLAANGRVNLSLQLPLLLLIYGGYIISMAGYCLLAAGALNDIFSHIPSGICCAAAIGIVWIISTSGIIGRQEVLLAAGVELIIAAVVILFSAVISRHSKNGIHPESAQYEYS